MPTESEPREMFKELDETSPVMLWSFTNRIIWKNHLQGRYDIDTMARLIEQLDTAFRLGMPPTDERIQKAYEDGKILFKARNLTELENFSTQLRLMFLNEQEQQAAKTMAIESLDEPLLDILNPPQEEE